MLPTSYGDPHGEYWRLINGVSMWDVAAQRQIEVAGPDAAELVRILCPRDLYRLKSGAGWYVPVCDHRGVIINDPIVLKHADDRYWFSIADADLLWWVRAVAAERGLTDVGVFEAQAAPLAVQGPKAGAVVAALLGDWVAGIKHFHFAPAHAGDIPILVARSGWSKQSGFELYLLDATKGWALWQAVKEAGAPYGIGPGTPNPVERVESGLLSWGGDTDDETNPFEVRMERYVDLHAPDDVIGMAALRRIHADGPRRRQLGIFVDHPEPFGAMCDTSRIEHQEDVTGKVTAHAYSPRLQRNIGLALVPSSLNAGDVVTVHLARGEPVEGELTELPFAIPEVNLDSVTEVA